MQPLATGVCSWSIDRARPVEAVRTAAERHGVRVVHLGFFDGLTPTDLSASQIRAAAAEAGVEISGTFAAFRDEDYGSIAALAATGGYASDERYAERLDFTRRVADLAAELGVGPVAIHIGTIPRDAGDPRYAKLLARGREAADLLAERRRELLLETGREPAEVLLRFVQNLQRENARVNFDPGNFLLYGTGDPVQGVTSLRPLIAHVHLKDAVPSDQPGIDWGTEATLGSGQARIARVVSRLRAGGYQGPLVVERTSGRGDPGDLEESIAYLQSLLG